MIDKIKEFQGLNITFNTGEACNLKCKYCYEVNKKPTTLSLEDAKKFIDLIISDPDPVGAIGTKDEWILKSGIVLDFIGGDSLMYPKLVDDIVSYFIFQAHLHNYHAKDRWRMSISTNGTLFSNPDVRKFCEKYANNLSLGVSIDGCPEIHDMNRVYNDGRGSMNDILEWWGWYRTYFGDSSTKATANKQSIPYLFKSLKFMYEELGITQIMHNFIMEDMELEQSDLDELDHQFALCVDYVLEHKNDLYWSMIDKMTFAEAKSFTENCEESPNRGKCGSGNMPALSPNGKIYPCFRFLPHTLEVKSDYSVGSLQEGFNRKENFKFIRDQTREKLSSDKCKECEIESACPYCLAGGISEKGYPYRTTYGCEITKLQVKWAREYWRRYDSI